LKPCEKLLTYTKDQIDRNVIEKEISDVKLALEITPYVLPPSGKVFEVWMVDANYRASGYPLSLGEISANGTLSYNENLVFSPTYTDVVVTLEPENDKDPKPNWSQSVAGYWLVPPFGQ
jgi:hypothetical protein